MSFLKSALELAAKGFHVFPLIPNGKLPLIEDFPTLATRDPEQIKKWWLDPVLAIEQPYNVAISTSKFGDNEGLLVVDVDNKGDKNGDDELFRLELEGRDFPETFEQRTPTGGRHLVYRVHQSVKQGTNVLGRGLDVRSRGGFIVGAGSRLDIGAYSYIDKELRPSPEWIEVLCGTGPRRSPDRGTETRNLARDSGRANDRARHYLEHEAPLAIEGNSGDQTTYAVACRVKDFGVDALGCYDLMRNCWNDRCSPPWSMEDLHRKVLNAYNYGNEPVGVASPEAQFKPTAEEKEKLHPIQELNKEFAFVIAGGGSHILWKTTDHKKLFKLEHLGIQAFHQKLASNLLYVADGKSRPVSELWMKSSERRSYDGICFAPGKRADPRFYNLWQGFAVEPLTDGGIATLEMQRSLQMFTDHMFENVCTRDKNLFNWLMGYFAHLIQRPWEKPLVALVFRGSKGVGKNALIDCIGHLLGNHYLLTSNRRYLVGNFNGHMENLLLFALDEAFWSGDKQAEGTLKDLITGKTHVVEHKGKEPYAVENCTRVVIIGNEEWLVPATQDERRYAVFNVGEGRKQDRSYFQSMRKGMEAGGYRLLLRYLLDYDLSNVEVNAAPSTAGLLDQKVSSLDPFYQWWLDCLTEGKIKNSDFGTEWETQVDKERFRNAFRRYTKERNIRSRVPEDRAIGKLIKHCLPSIESNHKRREGSELVNSYRLPSLDQARKEWETFIGHPNSWV